MWSSRITHHLYRSLSVTDALPPTTPGRTLRDRFILLPLKEPRPRRILQLMLGLVLFGAGLALGVEAAYGVAPWTVFHQGVSIHTPLSIGTATVLFGFLIFGAFPFFREPFGLGTLLNIAIIGPIIDLTLWAIPDLSGVWRVLALLAAPATVGLASGLYIGAGLGPGPRDGMMTAMERRGVKVWLARSIIEFTALAIGWLLGGDVGLGTVWIAGSIGWFVDLSLRWLRIDSVAPVPTS